MKKHLLIGLTLAVLISSCSKDQDLAAPEQKDQTAGINTPPTIETVKLSGNWRKGYYKGELIAYEKKNNMNLFLGDILIPNDEISDRPQQKNDKIMGTGITGSDYLWQNRTMNYVLDATVTGTRKQWVITAMKNWTNSSGFRFLDVSNYTDKGDYVHIAYGTIGNNSYVGRIGGGRAQGLNLQDDGVGVVVHELGHAIGMYHEQARSDRDQYITIIWDNIQEGWQPQYFQYASTDNVIKNAPKTKFDFNSIMLYPSINTSAVDIDSPTMTKLNGDIWGDNIYSGTDAPSATDAKWVQARYQKNK